MQSDRNDTTSSSGKEVQNTGRGSNTATDTPAEAAATKAANAQPPNFSYSNGGKYAFGTPVNPGDVGKMESVGLNGAQYNPEWLRTAGQQNPYTNHATWNQDVIAQGAQSRTGQQTAQDLALQAARGQGYGADQQRQAYGLSLAAANGQSPSVAQEMYNRSVLQANQALRRGVDNTTAQGMSMAASSRGGLANSAMAQRQAMMQAGQANLQGAIGVNDNLQNAAATNAALRASEMAQARGEVAGISGQMVGSGLQGTALAQGGANAMRAGDQFDTTEADKKSEYDDQRNFQNTQGNEQRALAYNQLYANQLDAGRNFMFGQQAYDRDKGYQYDALAKGVAAQNAALNVQQNSGIINGLGAGAAALGDFFSSGSKGG